MMRRSVWKPSPTPGPRCRLCHATHDLEIRGAGELLGEGQSGQIQAVGFTLYMEMLERAVKAIRKGEQPNWSSRSVAAGNQPAPAGTDPRGLSAGRACAPDSLQAHRQRRR